MLRATVETAYRLNIGRGKQIEKYTERETLNCVTRLDCEWWKINFDALLYNVANS